MQALNSDTLTPRPRLKLSQDYGFAFMLLAAACLTQWVLRDVLPGAEFLFIIPTIMIAGVLFGTGPAFLTLALSFTFVWIFLTAPYGTYEITDTGDAMQLITFIVIGILSAWLGARLRTSERERNETRRLTSTELETKGRYLENMSHEIRTPLGSIVGFSELMTDPGLEPRDRLQYAEMIQRNSHRLAALMDDLFHLVDIDSRKIQIERATLNLIDVVDESLDMVRKKNSLQKVTVQRNKPDSLPKVYGDRVRIKQIISSLVETMATRVPNGTVQVHISQNSQDEAAHFILQVSGQDDKGRRAYLSKETETQLMNPFAEGNETNTSPASVGLGLMRAKQIAQAMGGDLQVMTGSQDTGSTIDATLSLDIVHEVAVQQIATHAFNFTSHRILIAEDNLDNRTLIERILSKTGATLGFAENGLLALEAITDQSYDLVLMDIQMPQMDGLEATRRMRERVFKKPIIALTANAMKEDRDRCLAAGCDDYLTKPIQTTLLLSTISMHFDGKSTEAQTFN